MEFFLVVERMMEKTLALIENYAVCIEQIQKYHAERIANTLSHDQF